MMFRILFAFDALFVLILGYFFVDLLQYQPSAGTLGLWLLLLGVPVALLGGGWAAKSAGRRTLGTIILAVLAIPPLLYALFILAILLFEPNYWR